MGKAKKVNYELIGCDSVIGHPMYTTLRYAVGQWHQALGCARIALAWNLSWKPDVDGRVTLGQCKKASDLDRELSEWDFIILIRRAFWRDERVSDKQRVALIDHELCHAEVKYDAKGHPVIDERGRAVYRLRKHDIEEFTGVIARHGLYKRDLENFFAALPPMKLWRPCEQCAETPGWVEAADRNGMLRCACWTAYQAQRNELVAAS